jgi:aminobenzoyl-glutamate utilization protein B
VATGVDERAKLVQEFVDSIKPGVAYRAPIVEGAPGRGEGHNSDIAISIVSALAVRREGIEGTLQIWPGIAGPV